MNGGGAVAPHDVPIEYMRRTRDYYRALGYQNDYAWAHHVDAPFTPLAMPLAQARVAVVTTAAPYRPDKGDQGPGAPYNGGAKFFVTYSGDTSTDPDLRIAHVSYDRQHTLADDMNTWFPLRCLRQLAVEGIVGAVGPRFHGAPTNRSQRVTVDADAPEILRRCREDGADGVVLAPNCPVCHQTASLVARHLESNGIPTVVMGCAKDIVELCGVPRFCFSDFPLGNSAGRPHDAASQRETLLLALRLLAGAPGPRCTVQSSQRWAEDPAWKLDFMNPARLPPEELERRRQEFAEQKRIAKAVQRVSIS